jgi:DNA-binding GntR family transcriptional regulator
LDTEPENPFARQDLLPERIAQHLRARIASGSVKPNQRLTELELTRQYDVSRVPLREAFRILATEGLISLAPHRGATVIPLSEKELRELFGARSAIEEFAARILAEDPAAHLVQELRALNRNMKAAVGSLRAGQFSFSRYARASLRKRFARLLLRASKGPFPSLPSGHGGCTEISWRFDQGTRAGSFGDRQG